MSHLSFALIGPGRVGTALAYLLREQGLTLRTVIGRSTGSLQRAERYLQGGNPDQAEFTVDIRALPRSLDFVLLGVRDDEIAGVVETLWQQNLLSANSLLIHLSGVQPSDAGQLPEMPAIRRLALHPLQAIASIDAGIELLTRCVWSLEGDTSAVDTGKELLALLGVRWLRIAREQKVLYHAAACMASNYLVTIAELAREMLTQVGFPPDLAAEALQPLIEGTVQNLRTQRPADALTGPVARGDAGTVAKHLQAIRAAVPDLLVPYAELGKATLRFAKIADKTIFTSLFQREIEALNQSNPEKEEN